MKIISKNRPAPKTAPTPATPEKAGEAPKDAAKKFPSAEFLRSLPKPDVKKPDQPSPLRKLKLTFESSDGETSMMIGNGAYPRESARTAALAERERGLQQAQAEQEELLRKALEAEKKAAERERGLRELEALIAARESLLEAREKRVAENAAAEPQEGAALDQVQRALDQREESFRKARAELDEREKTVAEREKNIRDADALEKLKEDIARREKELKDAEAALREREEFLETSENLICEKGQMLVERETQLDQLEEEIRARLDSTAPSA